MKLYLTIIGIGMLIISACNIAFHTTAWYYIIALVVLCTAAQFALDGFIAYAISKLPDRLFGVDNPRYNVSKWETQLYLKLRVRSWKDKVWELGWLGGFSKKNLQNP